MSIVVNTWQMLKAISEDKNIISVEKQDGRRYRLIDDILVSVRDRIPCVIDVTDTWKIIRK